MADTKITALTAITTVDPAADVLPIVDVSDTSMAASGTTKKITSNQILGAGGTATLASATITGDLTVDTSTLKVDSTNNRVGIGTASPGAIFDIYQATLGTAYFRGGYAARQMSITATSDGSNDGAIHTFSIGSSAGQFAFANSSGTRMTLDSSGNVGIGVTPAGTGGCLQLKSGITFPATQVASSDANTLDDYEEGTWTVGLTFGGASTGLTTNANLGKYTKIGNQVTVTGYISLTNKGSATGPALITGLPFLVGSNSYGAVSLYLVTVTFADYPEGYSSAGTYTIPLQQVTNAGVRSNITDANFANNSEIILSLTYFV